MRIKNIRQLFFGIVNPGLCTHDLVLPEDHPSTRRTVLWYSILYRTFRTCTCGSMGVCVDWL